jgi:hypothetical protein
VSNAGIFAAIAGMGLILAAIGFRIGLGMGRRPLTDRMSFED